MGCTDTLECQQRVHGVAISPSVQCMGECLPGACPVHYLCIKYLISSPKFILTLGNPPSRPHQTANLLCKTPCISRNKRIQQHKMSLTPLPTTTLAIVINWVQGMGQILRHSKLFGEVGAKTGTSGEWSKKDARRANALPMHMQKLYRELAPCALMGVM